MFDRLRQDLLFALRGLRRAPSFVVTVVLILGAGIGMSTSMFSVFRTVLVQRLPVTDQDHIVVMWTYRANEMTDFVSGTKDLSVLRKSSRTMSDIAAIAHWPATPTPFRFGDRSVEINRGMVTGNFFAVLGARPALGRLFTDADDDAPGSAPSAFKPTRPLVLSYRAWHEQFGGDSTVVGKHLVDPLLNTDYTIIGVAPAGLSYPAGVDYWMPMWSGWSSGVSSFAVGRLKAGATVAQAQSEYLGVEQRAEPAWDFRAAHAATFTRTILGDVRPVMLLLTIAVSLLLLIACVNVGNLMLLRATSRAREIAIRQALGAGYGDIVRQLIIEAAVLATAGGTFGLAVADGALRTLIALAPPNLPRLDQIQLAGTSVMSAIAVSAAAVVVFGVAPALLAGRQSLSSPLRMDARSGTESRQRRLTRQVLVASQVALAMIMLGGAALIARSLARLTHQDAGYQSEHLSTFWFSWDARRDSSTAQLVALGGRLLDHIKVIPGITSAAPISIPPLLGTGVWQTGFRREGESDADARNDPAVADEIVGPDYFRTFGIPILRGRAFRDDDRETSPVVVVVSEAVARRFWPGQDAIGKRIKLPETSFIGGSEWRTVVGIAKETHLRTVRDATPTLYVPTRQGFWQGYFAIRSSVPLASLLPALRRAAQDVDPVIQLWNAQTMDEALAGPLAQPKLSTLLMSTFGVIALFLAATGLYGVMSSLVRDQTREIGVRIALGASAARVRRDVLGRATLVIGAGAIAGLGAALATSRLLSALLFEVSPTDPVSLGGACLLLLTVGALAAYLPARRATRIDPVVALRAE